MDGGIDLIGLINLWADYRISKKKILALRGFRFFPIAVVGRRV
jgi:hypothetical protein